MLRRRQGYTVVETIVAVSVGALVIGLGAALAFRHQRFHRDLTIVAERTEQLTQVMAVLPVSLRAITPGDGDIAPGGARDTSLEFRATIASGVVCDSAGGSVFLAPVAESPALMSVTTPPEVGDTAWLLDAAGSPDRWTAFPITAIATLAHVCLLGTAAPFGQTPRASLRLTLTGHGRPGAAVRITRPFRYSLYKASDGGWYVGAKDWSPALGRFNTIQPVAGPFLSASAAGMRFRYADSLGAAVPSGAASTAGIAIIEVALRSDSVLPGKYAHAASSRLRSSVAVAIRNRVR
jgi:hypothetical protein